MPPAWPYTGFGTAWFDFDNDGWLDLLAVNGAVADDRGRGRRRSAFRYDERKLLFRNLRRRPLRGCHRAGGRRVRSCRKSSRGAAFGDIDNDGDMDVADRQHQRAGRGC